MVTQASHLDPGQLAKTRIVILGGGFGGVTTARRLERLCRTPAPEARSERALPLPFTVFIRTGCCAT